jgi:adenosine deaminase
MPSDLRQLLIKAPKVELHVHLESTMAQAVVHRLTLKHDLDHLTLQAPHKERLREVWRGVGALLREPRDFHELVVGYGRRAWEQGIVYAEFSVAVERHVRRHPELSFDCVHAALESARAEVWRRFQVELRWLLEASRDSSTGSGSCESTVEWLLTVIRRGGLLGIVLGGFDQTRPLELFAPSLARARSAGFHVTAHAGERLDSIALALDLLKAERIGHAVACTSDSGLMARLRHQEVPLEVCPTSELVLGHLESLSPLGEMIRCGLKVNVSSDHPCPYGTSLIDELLRLQEELQLSTAELVGLLRNGIDASFAPEARKQQWRQELEDCELAASRLSQ